MGSVGIYRGDLMGTEVRDLLEGRVSDSRGLIPDRIVVYANNRDAVSQYSIDLGSATQEERQAFLRYWSSKSNLHNRNSQRGYDAAFRAEKQRIDPQTGTNVSDEDARAVAEIVRADRSYDALKKVLDADRNGTNPKFGGITVVRTRRRT